VIRQPEFDPARRPSRWPDCGAFELDAYWRELRRAVLALEEAQGSGSLRATLDEPGMAELIGPELCAAYRSLAKRKPPANDDTREKRREVVHALLDQLRCEAFVVRKWGRARGSLWQRRPALETAVDGDDVIVQRLDQVSARRFWGLGFVHDDDLDASDELARQAVRRSVRRFARDLVDLADVLRRRPLPEVLLVPGHADRRFEQLMLDVLDENDHHAEPARLAEDFCQKTDLRVRYPGLERVRGARVQVKATRLPRVHELRIADIRNRETLVILSPVTLAEFIDAQVHRRMEPLLDKAQLDAFWRCVQGEPTTIDELAPAIARIFDAALARPTLDPRGPMAAVPEALRVVIRSFVRHEAFRSTAALRVHEASGLEFRHGRDGRLRTRRSDPAS
jgi:hypothetical protein